MKPKVKLRASVFIRKGVARASLKAIREHSSAQVSYGTVTFFDTLFQNGSEADGSFPNSEKPASEIDRPTAQSFSPSPQSLGNNFTEAS